MSNELEEIHKFGEERVGKKEPELPELTEAMFESAMEVPDVEDPGEAAGPKESVAASISKNLEELEILERGPNYALALQQALSLVNDCCGSPLSREGKAGLFCPKCESKLAWEANGSTAWCPNEKCGWDTDTVRLVAEVKQCGPAAAANYIVGLGNRNPDSITGDEPGCYFHDKSFRPIRLALRIKKESSYVWVTDGRGGQFMSFKDGYWQNADGELRKECNRRLGDRSQPNRISAAIELLQIEANRFNTLEMNLEPLLVNCKNGMLDCRSMTLLPHDPKYRSTIQVPITWNAEAKSNVFNEFVKETLQEIDVRRVQEMCGYLLTTDCKVKKYWTFCGEGNTGKSTWLNLITALSGPSNYTIAELKDIVGNRFTLSRLEGKLLSIFDDVSGEHLENVGPLKTLTGGSPTILCERKGENAYLIPLTAKVVTACNEVPTFSDKSQAMYNRMELIRLVHIIPKERQNPFILKLLTSEEGLQAAFVWAAQGLQRLQANHLQFEETEESRAATEEFQLLNDNRARFAKDMLVVTPGSKSFTSRKELYSTYKQWCRSYGSRAYNKFKFNVWLELKFGLILTAQNGVRGYKNVSFNVQEQDDLRHVVAEDIHNRMLKVEDEK